MYSEGECDRISANTPCLLNSTRQFKPGDWFTLLDLSKSKACFTVHASSLNNYLRVNMIPRGLRVQKGPAMFREDQAFNQKWKAILNKCFTDLMLLIMVHSMAIVKTNKDEIEEIKTRLQTIYDLETFNCKIRKIQEEVETLEKALKEFKIRKFKRDSKDYANDKVYSFTTRPKYKGVTWAGNTYSDIDSANGDESTGTFGDKGPSSRAVYKRAAKGRVK